MKGVVSVAEKKTNTAKKAKKQRIYIVKKGDTLTGIAGKMLGDSTRYGEIVKLNNLATDILKVGRELKLPQTR